MSNPPASSAEGTPSLGAMAAGSSLPYSSSIATPSMAPRSSKKKRDTSKSLIDSIDAGTPARRTTGDGAPLMVAGAVEFTGGNYLPEKASLPRSSGKIASQAADITPRRDAVPSKPKRMKLSLQKTNSPSGDAGTSQSSRSFLFKNMFSFSFVLLVIVAGLATTPWTWRAIPSSLDTGTMEGQVAELQEVLRKTTKMMQVQLDLVDIKIHKEVEELRRNLEDKIDEQTITFSTELRNLMAKTDDIESSLKDLLNAGFPSREDVLTLINSVVDKRAAEGSGNALSLDDVRAVAKRLVEVELEKHSADGISRVDYALGSGGGKVVDHSDGFYHGLGIGWHLLSPSFLLGASNKHPLANKILEPSFGEPGQCLPLKGSSGYVEIALRTSIFPDAFSLEHVAKNAAYDISSAPKEFRVFGWLDSFRKDNAAQHFMSQVMLGSFVYDINKTNVQTFPVPVELTGKLVNLVRLEILSNYGSSSHTCIYRFRVHGSVSTVNFPSLSKSV
ncbi:hypothetical protein KP509_15G005200 [Ceratopteris richardii]|uniref:SUN domain-containing protein n=1 Tax=Ceratopteris richardii TaxID=49495 RepID=A0A8T2T2D4_CERRI|nr:hypothetical protein KP509_15G005200 [Ceratopteris richardii]